MCQVMGVPEKRFGMSEFTSQTSADILQTLSSIEYGLIITVDIKVCHRQHESITIFLKMKQTVVGGQFIRCLPIRWVCRNQYQQNGSGYRAFSHIKCIVPSSAIY
jgi:hypothetical protein